jgi:hypothetical protein
VTARGSITDATVIRRNQRVAFRSLTGQSGAVLLHLDTAAYHGVNEVGGLVWDLVNDGIRFDDLITQLQSQLGEVPPSLTEDITDFLEELRARDLVVLEPPSP